MKLNYKIFLIIVCLLIAFPSYATHSLRGMDGFEWGRIDAKKNARMHSNMGNIYFEEKNYISAMKEYEIAYKLDTDSQASATYLYNISRCFTKLENYNLAKNALENVIKRDCINITYYEALVDTYVKLGIQKKELKKALSETNNPYNRIIAGLIYLKTGKTQSARMIFDEFVNDNPKMIITDDVKRILKRIN